MPFLVDREPLISASGTNDDSHASGGGFRQVDCQGRLSDIHHGAIEHAIFASIVDLFRWGIRVHWRAGSKQDGLLTERSLSEHRYRQQDRNKTHDHLCTTIQYVHHASTSDPDPLFASGNGSIRKADWSCLGRTPVYLSRIWGARPEAGNGTAERRHSRGRSGGVFELQHEPAAGGLLRRGAGGRYRHAAQRAPVDG